MTTGKEITQHDPDLVPWRDRTWRLIRRYQVEAPPSVGKSQLSGIPPGSIVTEIDPLFLEKNADGSYTEWKASVGYGPVGRSGKLSPDAEAKCEEVIEESDKLKLETFITQLEQSDKLATTVAKAMTNGKKKND